MGWHLPHTATKGLSGQIKKDAEDQKGGDFEAKCAIINGRRDVGREMEKVYLEVPMTYGAICIPINSDYS